MINQSAGWLADQEQKYRTVLYVADAPVNSSWTQTCIRQVKVLLHHVICVSLNLRRTVS